MKEGKSRKQPSWTKLNFSSKQSSMETNALSHGFSEDQMFKEKKLWKDSSTPNEWYLSDGVHWIIPIEKWSMLKKYACQT